MFFVDGALLDPSDVVKMNDLFRTFNMYENIEPVSDEIKVFQCEEADETSSINSALSAMSLRSIANSRCNENISATDDIQQRLKRIHQMVASRKETKDNEQEVIPVRRFLACERSIRWSTSRNGTMTMTKKNTTKRKALSCYRK